MNKQKSILFAAGLIPLLFMGIPQAQASFIDGYIKDGGTALFDAMATAERPNHYAFDHTNTSGFFSINTDAGASYTVSGTDYLYDRSADTTVANGGNAGTLDVVNTRSDKNILILVQYDTHKSVTFSEADDAIKEAELNFHVQHSIDFVTSDGTSYSSNGIGSDCGDHLTEIRSDANWESGSFAGKDILIGVTNDGFDGTGCMRSHDDTNIPDEADQHPYLAIDQDSSNIERTVMHELTHAYRMEHTDTTLNNSGSGSCTSLIPGIMNTYDDGSEFFLCSNNITNWIPDDDTTMEDNRLWY